MVHADRFLHSGFFCGGANSISSRRSPGPEDAPSHEDERAHHCSRLKFTGAKHTSHYDTSTRQARRRGSRRAHSERCRCVLMITIIQNHTHRADRRDRRSHGRHAIAGAFVTETRIPSMPGVATTDRRGRPGRGRSWRRPPLRHPRRAACAPRKTNTSRTHPVSGCPVSSHRF